VKLTKVTKSFGTKTVLSGLDLTVTRGESLVLVGQSGIGKSVLLKHVIGLLKPDSGTVEIDGEDLWKVSAKDRDRLRRKFGMSFQEGALFDSMDSLARSRCSPKFSSSTSPRPVSTRSRRTSS
jgi:phospholipid/cholesterol/gamma-HCH transport system ATP-binding protein